ncbi:VCBS repeat-containing protein [Shewanella sp. VB17]|uniref:FG-GAP repeat domain-containing protein n=1 Tax=Shewanella sp. VB17 TaxID=2739432 RepID=UPI001566BF54|nr:VCBS repeat-containing protein [Shewanella sp. VB17]NRD75520.1 VCBS repeat-containing protein [Shewanella sp. VB17]
MNLSYLSFLYSILVGMVIFSCELDAASGKRDLMQVEQVIQAPFQLTHSLLAADLLSTQGKELIVFGIDERLQKWLGVYAFDGVKKQYILAHKVAIPASFYGFDLSDEVKDIKGAQALYFLSNEQVFKYTPRNEEIPFKVISDVASIIKQSRTDYLRHIDFVRDLNGDGLADILVGDFDHARVFMAKEDGGFKQQKLMIKADVNMFQDSIGYTNPTLYIADMTLDGRSDIINIGEGELEIYRQTKEGMFEEIATFFPIRQAISGIDWWLKRDAFGESLDQSELTYRKVETIRDINHDGLTDLVLRYTKSTGVLDRVNDYEILLGEEKEGKLVFPKKASSVIHAEGTLTDLQFIDIDNDGKLEVMVAGFDIGVAQIIGALLSGSIDQDVYLFKMNNQDRFTKKPNIVKQVELNFSLSSGHSGSPVVKFADFNGDERQDILLSEGDRSLNIFLGTGEQSLLQKRSDELDVRLPKEGDMLTIFDLNEDGKDDILIKYGRQDEAQLLSQFRIILFH